jgi:hypothetical protein
LIYTQLAHRRVAACGGGTGGSTKWLGLKDGRPIIKVGVIPALTLCAKMLAIIVACSPTGGPAHVARQ